MVLRRMVYGLALYQKGNAQGFIWMCGVQSRIQVRAIPGHMTLRALST